MRLLAALTSSSPLTPANHHVPHTQPFGPEQDETPLIDALVATAGTIKAPFFFPGHKMGAGAPRRLRRRLALQRALRYDLPELPELDNLFAPEGAILRAQELAARAFCAERTWWLVNGSTSGVIASVMACVQLWRRRQCGSGPVGTRSSGGPVLILPRNAHQSAYHALVSSGAEPCWLMPEYDDASGLCLGAAASSVADALQRHGERVAAVLLVSPTYEGVLSDVKSCAEHCAAAGVPLIVDEAHGGHLHFLPPNVPMPHKWEMPRPALSQGADLVVQSSHKTLGSLTQSAMLHVSSRAVTSHAGVCEALGRALEMVQSSSPSYLLMASLDAARWQMAAPHGDGRARLLRATHLARDLRDAIDGLPYGPRLIDLNPGPGAHSVDPLRLTLAAPTRGSGNGLSGGREGLWSLDGFELDDALIAEGVYAELPQARSITLALSAGTSRTHVQRLLRVLRRGQRHAVSAGAGAEATGQSESCDGALEAASASVVQPSKWEGALRPRDAFFSGSRVVAASDAVGERAAELVCPYPPGIPVLVPGEIITEAALTQLRTLREAGCSMTGCSDATLESITVLGV
jgi:arginine decarboxylase